MFVIFQVHSGVSGDSILMDLEGKTICEVICPECCDKVILSSYQRTSFRENLPPLRFKSFNFERHLIRMHGKKGKYGHVFFSFDFEI